MKTIVPLTLLCAVMLGATSVRTREGRSIEGPVRLEAGGLVMETAGTVERIPWARVQRAVVTGRPRPERPVAQADGSLPSGWAGQDVGDVHRAGTAALDEKGVFTMHASGWGAWGPEDSFHFVGRPFSGDGQIIARIAAVDDSHGKMVAGVMMRASLKPDATMACACLHPTGQIRLGCRPLREIVDFADADDAVPKRWVRLARSGDRFSAYRSSDGRYWEHVHTQKIEMGQEVLAGLATWTTANTSLGSVTIDSVQVIPGTPGASYFVEGSPLRQGVALRDGSILAGEVVDASEAKGVRLIRDGAERIIPWASVARLHFNPAPADLGDKKGLWLTNGDFIEGQPGDVTNPIGDWNRALPRQIALRSILFGPRSFQTAREVICAMVADARPAPGRWRVECADGSVFVGDAITVENSALFVDGVIVPDPVEISR